MKKIPFVSNSEDDMHCVNAVFRMVHQYFLKKDLSWEEIDKITKSEPGKGTWTILGEMYFQKKGIQVVNIEPVDYQQLFDKGASYFYEIFGKETADYHLKNTNIKSLIPHIPEYLKIIKHETRRINLNEIVDFVKNGALVGAEVNSGILNDRDQFSLHFILIFDYDGKNLIVHDPGLPPIEARKVALEDFDKCFNFEGANGGITVFKKL